MLFGVASYGYRMVGGLVAELETDPEAALKLIQVRRMGTVALANQAGQSSAIRSDTAVADAVRSHSATAMAELYADGKYRDLAIGLLLRIENVWARKIFTAGLMAPKPAPLLRNGTPLPGWFSTPKPNAALVDQLPPLGCVWCAVSASLRPLAL